MPPRRRPSFLARLWRLRPFLWLLVLFLAALAVSFTWEYSTSYDDGGIGSASFLVVYTVGLPYVATEALFHTLGFRQWPNLGTALGVVVVGVIYLWFDRLTVRWSRRNAARSDVPA
jgi:hypothetical protein